MDEANSDIGLHLQLDEDTPTDGAINDNSEANVQQQRTTTQRSHTRTEVLKSAKRRRTTVDLRSRHWFLTWNNYAEQAIRILLALGAKNYAFQEEKASTGTPHLQGVFSFQHAKKWSQLNNKCDGKAVWAVCRNVAAAKRYCQKEETRNGRQWIQGYKMGRKKVKDPLEGKKPYNWQQDIIDMIQEEPDDRKIYWYWSNRGCIGKSALVKHLVMAEDAVYCGGRFQDAFYAIKAEVEKVGDVQVVLFDLPRAMGNKISYTAMEGIKNGLIFNSKYESGKVLFNTPHIFVLANYEPDLDQMSNDRWVVKNLDNEEDI